MSYSNQNKGEKKVKYWIIGILLMCLIVAGGFFLTEGFAADNKALDGKGSGIPQIGTESSNMLPNTPLADDKTALSADEKVSASALTCTIKDSRDYVVDLRLRNPGIETRTITIDPSGTKMELLPRTNYSKDLNLAKEVSIINILVDDGSELQVQSPPCTTGGSSGSSVTTGSSSGSGVSGLAMQGQKPSPPVPELSPLVLTLAGIC